MSSIDQNIFLLAIARAEGLHGAVRGREGGLLGTESNEEVPLKQGHRTGRDVCVRNPVRKLSPIVLSSSDQRDGRDRMCTIR